MPSRAHFWQTPWRFSQSFVVMGGIVLSLFAVQLLIGGEAVAPPYPANRIMFAVLALAAMTAGAMLAESPFARWLRGLHLPLACGFFIAVILVLSTLMQSPSVGGITDSFLARLHVSSPHGGWPLPGCLTILFINIAAAVGGRIRRFQAKQTFFFIVHGGILLAAGMAMCSSSEVASFYVRMPVGGSGTDVFVSQGRKISLPAKLRMDSFDLESYPPKLALVSSLGNGRENVKAADKWCSKKGENFLWDGIEAEILEFLPLAIFRMDKNGWESTEVKGACPAAFVQVRYTDGRKLAEGWVSSGGSFSNNAELPLGIGRALIMLPPPPRVFRTEFQVVENGLARRETVVVNRPLHVGPWWVYLTDYDVGRGAASRWAGFRIVRDPTLKYVYAGLAMILTGTFGMLWFKPEWKNG